MVKKDKSAGNCHICGYPLPANGTKCRVCRNEELWRRDKLSIQQTIFTRRIAKELANLDILPKDEHVRLLRGGGGLYICGPPGCGKTIYACALATEVYRQGYVYPDRPKVDIKFIHSLNLLEEIRASLGWRDTHSAALGGSESKVYEEPTTRDILKYYSSVGLLILDDLGAERPTDWTLSVLHLIINNRYEECLPTIFTSNLDLSALGEQLDDRISSRIYEMCEVVVYGTEDLRLKRRRKQAIG